MTEIATTTTWKHEPIDNPKRINITLHFTAKQFLKLTKGLIPQQMEDKWFIFYENDMSLMELFNATLYKKMKKLGFVLLAIVILSIILYVTFVIAAIKIAFGATLIIVTALLLWWLWIKIVNKLN